MVGYVGFTDGSVKEPMGRHIGTMVGARTFIRREPVIGVYVQGVGDVHRWGGTDHGLKRKTKVLFEGCAG